MPAFPFDDRYPQHVLLAALFAQRLLLGDRTRARFEHWRARLRNGSHATVSWIMGIAGVLILVDALPGLPLDLPR